VKISSTKLRWGTAAVILLLLFLLRPGASQLKSRIIASISSGVGRSVDLGSVHFRLLPRPGFDLETLVVYDDPAFGAEPLLRASEVTAILRLTSLLRGRIEIARLELTEPSLNLVRGENGHWNLETLLERAARTPLAPTGKAKSEPRPAFPYIQASSARINFKNGPEKTPYSLTNADFSLWQDSENTWGIRLKAQPVRTDLNLNDTGILRVDGSWQRADSLRDTPLQFTAEWSRAQLGQLSKLFSGTDQGWRGDVQLEVTLHGTPGALQIASDASIQDFRRFDITTGEPLRLSAHCDGQYSSLDRRFRDLLCNAPLGVGLISLTGWTGLPGSHAHNLTFNARDVPASALVELARRAKKYLPDDLTAGGTLRGSVIFDADQTTSSTRVEGHGEIAGFRLASALGKAELGPETIPFSFSDGSGPLDKETKLRLLRKAGIRMPERVHVEFGPFPAAIGKATAQGWIDRTGYSLALSGDGELGKTLRAARLLGIPASKASIEGSAQLDLVIAGLWAGFGHAVANGFPVVGVTGTARLRNVRIPIRGTGEPVEVGSATVSLTNDGVRVEKLIARFANTNWTGSLEMPRGCGNPGDCDIHFQVHGDRIAFDELSDWANPRPRERPWYRVLQSSEALPTFLANVRATGSISANDFRIRGIVADGVTAKVSLQASKLTISDLNGNLLGGEYHGEWRTDFTVSPAASSGSGTFTAVSLAQLAETMHDPWISGTAKGSYQIKAAGVTAADFWKSVEGTLRFDVNNGTLPHISPEDQGPLKVSRFSGEARLRTGKLEMKDARLTSPSGVFEVSGSASLRRDLDIRLERNGPGTAGYAITGTLAKPRVAPLGGTEQARLKPQAAK